MSTDPNEDSGSPWFPLILAVVISIIVVFYVLRHTRDHASAMDEATPARGHEDCASASSNAAAAQRDDNAIGSRKINAGPQLYRGGIVAMREWWQ